MGYNFINCDRDQLFLLPPSMRDWLPEGHLVWFILDAVDQLDLSSFLRRYRSDGWGRAAYSPKMMVALLFYAYCTGIRSSRKIERACQENVAFKVITGNKVPDHTTISRFRQEFQEELAGLFTEVLWLCGRAGLVKVGTVVVDGTKMAGNASLSANRTWRHLEEEVKRMLKEAEAADAAEEAQVGDDVPEELVDRNKRLARLNRLFRNLLLLALPPEEDTVRILKAWDRRRRQAYKPPIRVVHPTLERPVFDLGIVRELIPKVVIFRKLDFPQRSLIVLKLLSGLACKKWAQRTINADDLRDKNIASYTMFVEKPLLDELDPAIGDLVAFEAHGYEVLDRTFWVCELLVWPELA